MLLFFTYFALVSSQLCDKYQCKLDSQEFTSSTCIMFTSGTYYVSPCKSGTCPISLGSNNSTCMDSSAVSKISAYPGEKCTANANCTSDICEKGICKGSAKGQPCITVLDCASGLYCSNAICISQISIGDSGCANDFSCTNNAACQNSQCFEYFSIKSGSQIANCTSQGINLLCSSGVCTSLGNSFICIDLVENIAPWPYTCTFGGVCKSKPETFTGISFTNECICGLGKGNAHCNLFSGDKYAKSLMGLLKSWVSSSAIKKCNSALRFDSNCLADYWGKQDLADFMYYYLMFQYYPYVAEADDCVSQVYLPDFYSAKMNYLEENSGSWGIATAGIIMIWNLY